MLIRALLLVLLLSQCAFGQKAGSVAAYRQQYENEMRNAQNEADWNSAKKLCKFFDPIEKYKDTKQDFSAIEVPDAGAIGFMQAWPFKVISIVDKKNVILSMSDLTFWLEDFDTSGMADGESVRILDPIEFTATKQYVTASGASRTVKAFKMIDKPSLAKHKEKLAEEAAKKAKDKRKAISQVFDFADGKKR